VAQRPTSKAGKLAEDFAARLLSSKGYKIIDRNFRSRFGEIDIIATKGDCLIFIEVKARWSLKFGRPEEAVTAEKIRKITKTAEYYSMLHPKSLRIEVLALEIEDGNLKSARVISVY